MPGVRMALVQMNPVLGDLSGNAAAMRASVAEAASAGARVVVFPELAVTGCPLEDLAMRRSFAADASAAVERLACDVAADGLGDVCVVAGCLVLPGPRRGMLLLQGGCVVKEVVVPTPPNPAAGNGGRHAPRGEALTLVRLAGVTAALVPGEEVLAPGAPALAAARDAGAELIISAAAYPYRIGEFERRKELLGRLASEAGVPLVCVNLVGGQDDHVFDGGSLIALPCGHVIGQAERFREDLQCVEVPVGPVPDSRAHANGVPRSPGSAAVSAASAPTSVMDAPPQPLPVVSAPRGECTGVEGEVWQALITGLRDYVRKNGFESVIIALSGGIDSAVATMLAVDALGPGKVVAVSMPSSCSTDHSQSDAADLAQRAGVDFRSIPIQPLVDLVLDTIFLEGVAVENVQARMRSLLVMALSNQEGHLMLNTGNKTEYGCGHATLYGDSAGGYAPLKDVPKTLVWRLARWRNLLAEQRGQTPPVPEHVILKEPSPELQPGQIDSELLPAPYEVLDWIVAGYVDRGLGRDALVEGGLDADVVDRVIALIERGEFKRHQAPPGPRISARSFGRDRRLPITNRYVDRGATGHEVPSHA